MDNRTRTKWNLNIRDPDIQPLYAKWLTIIKQEHDPAFDNFEVFYWWSLANGYDTGMKLMRRCLAEPFSPDNCYYILPTPKAWTPDIWEAVVRFNRTVAQIRQSRDLPPLGGKMDV